MPKKLLMKIYISNDSIHVKIQYREICRERKISCGLGLRTNSIIRGLYLKCMEFLFEVTKIFFKDNLQHVGLETGRKQVWL